MLATRLLNVFTAGPYQSMTLPQFRVRLGELFPGGSFLAVGVSFEGQPAGLGTAEIMPDGRQARILSLFISESHRKRGAGTALVAELELQLQKRGCTGAELLYLRDGRSAPAIERILDRRNWGPSYPRMLLCRADRRILETPWIRRYRPADGFSIFPWCELTPQERAEIERRQAVEEWYPETVSPFRDEGHLEPANSLGVRRDGEVVGWLVTHRVAPKMVRYSSLFVRADVRAQNCAVALITEAIRRQEKLRGIDTFGCFTVMVDNPSMMKFTQRLAPYLASIHEGRGSRKSLLPRP